MRLVKLKRCLLDGSFTKNDPGSTLLYLFITGSALGFSRSSIETFFEFFCTLDKWDLKCDMLEGYWVPNILDV